MNHKPVRKITNRGAKKTTGVFPSQKNQCLIEYESLLELDYFYLLEFDEDVINYEEQPLSIPYMYLDRSYKYTPDLLVKRKNKTQLIEVKPYEKLQKLFNEDRWTSKFKAAANYCKYNGFSDFLLITEKEIRNGMLLRNVKYLFSYSQLKVPSTVILNVRNEIINNGSLQMSRLLQNICIEDNIDIYYTYILSMLYHHYIITDLSVSIDKNSIIFHRS